MPNLYKNLSLSAQAAYAELQEQAQALELAALSSLTGSFQRRAIKGYEYIYFGYRDPIGGVQRRVYVGPADARTEKLVAKYAQVKAPKKLAPLAQAALALGCATIPAKHYRIVRQLAAYGFFKAGGILIGTHAFAAMANMLGVRWVSGSKTLDVDFAHAGRNVSLALPADIQISVHDALTSLEMGLLPMHELSGKLGAQYRSAGDPELRLDFLTSMARRSSAPVVIQSLDLALEPLKFMEFSLEGTTQCALLGREGACVVNLPLPARYAVHKLIVCGERKISERTKAIKDIEQAAALAEWHLDNDSAGVFNTAWQDALGRGRGWRTRAEFGKRALLQMHPELDERSLWKDGAKTR